MSADLTGYDVYRIFTSLKAHFTTKYDVSKYGYKSKMTAFDKYESKGQKYLFEKKAKDFQTELICRQAIASKLVRDPSTYITDINREDYIPLSKYTSSVRFFEEDLKCVLAEKQFKSLVQKDFVLGLMDGTITPEFICMFNRAMPIFKLIDEKTNQSLLWEIIKPRLTKYE